MPSESGEKQGSSRLQMRSRGMMFGCKRKEKIQKKMMTQTFHCTNPVNDSSRMKMLDSTEHLVEKI